VTSAGFTGCLLSLPAHSLLSVRVRVRPTTANSKHIKPINTNLNHDDDNDDYDDEGSSAARGRGSGENNSGGVRNELSDSLSFSTGSTFHGQAYLEIIKL
jgi:hypothetical protein